MWPSGNQALPLFIVGCIMLFALIFDDIFKKILKRVRLLEDDDNIVVDEKIGSYF
jgi:hypothetical protein